MLWIFAGWDEVFYLVMRGFFLFLSITQIFFTAECIKLKSWWCFPRELSGVHKTRTNLGLAVTFDLNVECACICSQLVVGFLLLSYSQISRFELLAVSPTVLHVLWESWFSFQTSSFDSANTLLALLWQAGLWSPSTGCRTWPIPIFSQRLWCAELKTSESLL